MLCLLPFSASVISSDQAGDTLWARLEQRIFEGKLKESKTKGKEVNWTVWNESTNSFPLFYCSRMHISQEIKHLLRSLGFVSFAYARCSAREEDMKKRRVQQGVSEVTCCCPSKIPVILRPCLLPKIFQDSPSHRILRHMHEALNIDENKN